VWGGIERCALTCAPVSLDMRMRRSGPFNYCTGYSSRQSFPLGRALLCASVSFHQGGWRPLNRYRVGWWGVKFRSSLVSCLRGMYTHNASLSVELGDKMYALYVCVIFAISLVKMLYPICMTYQDFLSSGLISYEMALPLLQLGLDL
jgi:hypothetical protein